MSEDLIVFEGETAITPDEVKRRVSIYFVIVVIAILLGIYGFRKYEEVPVLPIVIGVFAAIAGSIKRFPTRLIFNTRLKLLKADYLDVLGREKSMYIDLAKANYSKKMRGRTTPDDNELVIYQNIFTSYIAVNRLSHFSDAQLDQMIVLIKTLKESVP